MGTWSAGNFDSDAAQDVLAEVTGPVDAEIEGFMNSDTVGVEDLDQILACVAIKLALVEQCTASPPSEEEANELRAKVLEIFDREFDGLEPVAGHKDARRKVIVDTMDRFVQVSASRPAP
jgi:hypothetical protein